MALIKEEIINEIRLKSDIVEVISQYIKLEKKGRNYWGLCPFHQDSKPSLSVSPEKQIYRCFSCSMGGNVFMFLQEYKNFSFLEAVKELAEQANVDISFLQVDHHDKYDELDKKFFALNKLAKTYFSHNLHTSSGVEARDYLAKRKIDEKQINDFMIGYAPKSKDKLVNFLAEKGYSLNDIVSAGLAVNNEGGIFDYFSNRLMFPITDEDANIIGFSARAIQPDVEPKYLNTFETKIFKKDHLMYHWDIAKNEVRKSHNLIILEGFMDVISLSKLNIDNTIAIMGTNISDFHINTIKKKTTQVHLFLDGDDPGIKASIKASAKLLQNGFIVKVVNNKTNLDPDELVNSNQADVITEMLNNALHPVDFAINYYQEIYNLTEANDINKFIKEISLLINSIATALEKELFISKISELLHLSKDVLIAEFRKYEFKPKKIPDTSNISNQEQSPQTNRDFIKWNKRYVKAEQNMILQMLSDRRACEFYLMKVGSLNIFEYRLIVNDIIRYYNVYKNEQSVNINVFVSEFLEPHLAQILEHILASSVINAKYNEKALNDYAMLINDYTTEQEIILLKRKLKSAKNINEKQVITNQIAKMSKRLRFNKRG